MQLTNADRKLYANLDRARTRRESGLFAAEGTKCVLDTVGHFRVHALLATAPWVDAHANALPGGVEATTVKPSDLERMSHLSTPSEVMAIYHIPDYGNEEGAATGGDGDGLTLLLDRVQDPGNLGTIIRLADWFGVGRVVCSPDTVDVWSPKVVQATMGAIARVRCIYTSLTDYIAAAGGVEVCGTFLDGDSIYSAPLPRKALLVMGNEGQGISPEVARLVGRRLLIPSYPPGAATSESLNVSMATAIALSEFRRP